MTVVDEGYRGYRITTKGDMGGPRLVNGQVVTEGFVVVDETGCNAIPGAGWFTTVDNAKRGIDALIETGGGPSFHEVYLGKLPAPADLEQAYAEFAKRIAVAGLLGIEPPGTGGWRDYRLARAIDRVRRDLGPRADLLNYGGGGGDREAWDTLLGELVNLRRTNGWGHATDTDLQDAEDRYASIGFRYLLEEIVAGRAAKAGASPDINRIVDKIAQALTEDELGELMAQVERAPDVLQDMLNERLDRRGHAGEEAAALSCETCARRTIPALYGCIGCRNRSLYVPDTLELARRIEQAAPWTKCGNYADPDRHCPIDTWDKCPDGCPHKRGIRGRYPRGRRTPPGCPYKRESRERGITGLRIEVKGGQMLRSALERHIPQAKAAMEDAIRRTLDETPKADPPGPESGNTQREPRGAQ